MLNQAFLKFVVTDCPVHQVNLIVGDFLNKTIVFAAICDIQIALNATKPVVEHVVLTVTHAVLTRWMSHYLAMWRLMELKATLNQKLLEPLAFASTITQLAHFHVDQSLLLMGFPFAEYSKLLIGDSENQLFAATEHEELIQTVLDSLERHWRNCDQDVYISAVVLNPVYKTAPFAKISQLNLAGVFALICKLWTWFFGSSPPYELLTELQDYLGNKGAYVNFSAWVGNVQHEAERKQEHPDPLAMYEGMQYGGGEKSPLQRIAF
ncbi:hypothetical protein EDC04DRAFT_2604106 [Pisolithus marmoratus]|nr:hypothetical protein EDC04DRAFT_2604106 [Pisolithus marmoratus]